MAPSKAPAATWSKTGITGARWGIDTAEAILQLRALQANGDFDAYWALCGYPHRGHYAAWRIMPSGRRPAG